jgi:hypothetical protein
MRDFDTHLKHRNNEVCVRCRLRRGAHISGRCRSHGDRFLGSGVYSFRFESSNSEIKKLDPNFQFMRRKKGKYGT